MKKGMLKTKFIGITIVMMLFMVLTAVQIKAFDAVDEVKKIGGNANNIYTVYIGMAEADLVENFKGVKGWKSNHRPMYYTWERKYSGWGEVKAGASLTQRIGYSFGRDGHVDRMHVGFSTDSLRYAKEIYDAMYKSMEATYGPPQWIHEDSKNLIRVTTWENPHYVYQMRQSRIVERDGTSKWRVKIYSVDLSVYSYDRFPRMAR